MKYKSKIDWWFYLAAFGFAAVSVFLLVSGFLSGRQGAKIVCLGMGLLCAGLFFSLFLPVMTSTYSVLEDDSLFIKCGLLSADTIHYSDIVSIEETRNPTASAAPSLDRLGITYTYRSHSYNRNGYILISPRLKHEFVRAVLQKNPSICVKFRPVR